MIQRFLCTQTSMAKSRHAGPYMPNQITLRKELELAKVDECDPGGRSYPSRKGVYVLRISS